MVAWLAFAAAVGVVCAHPRLRRHRTIAVLCIGAYGTHIFCDLITGGVPLFSPLVLGVYGGPYLPFWSWIVLDGALLVYVYLVYRWLPLRRRIIPTARTPAGGEIDRGATTIRNIP